MIFVWSVVSSLSFSSLAQNQKLHTDTVPQDCANALEISSSKRNFFRVPLTGPGEKQEIRASSNSKHFFEREHNTGWLKFKASTDGYMSFMIAPFFANADFDFILVKLDSLNQCPDLRAGGITPIRANIARNDSTIGKETGLSPAGVADYRQSGKGNRYSNVLEVKRGDAFLLVIDDVYGSQKGFSLFFNYYKDISIEGEVLSEADGKPIKAEVSLEEPGTGIVLGKTQTNDDGTYNLETLIHKSRKKRHILAVDPLEAGQLYIEQSVTGEELTEMKFKFDFKARKLEKDIKVMAQDINFIGNKAIPINGSVPTIKRLARMMKKNRTVKISIEGHVNDPGAGPNCDDEEHLELSVNRAKYIAGVLAEKGVSEDRFTTSGYSCHHMLYPLAKTEYEQRLNRRVEIVVTEK